MGPRESRRSHPAGCSAQIRVDPWTSSVTAWTATSCVQPGTGPSGRSDPYGLPSVDAQHPEWRSAGLDIAASTQPAESRNHPVGHGIEQAGAGEEREEGPFRSRPDCILQVRRSCYGRSVPGVPRDRQCANGPRSLLIMPTGQSASIAIRIPRGYVVVPTETYKYDLSSSGRRKH